jgi:hypothetical protein
MHAGFSLLFSIHFVTIFYYVVCYELKLTKGIVGVKDQEGKIVTVHVTLLIQVTILNWRRGAGPS